MQPVRPRSGWIRPVASRAGGRSEEPADDTQSDTRPPRSGRPRIRRSRPKPHRTKLSTEGRNLLRDRSAHLDFNATERWHIETVRDAHEHPLLYHLRELLPACFEAVTGREHAR